MLETSKTTIAVRLLDGSEGSLAIYPISAEDARDIASRPLSLNSFYRFLKIVTRREDEFLMQLDPLCFFDILKAATGLVSPEVTSQLGKFAEAPTFKISTTRTA
jgi:hypothetical protein